MTRRLSYSSRRSSVGAAAAAALLTVLPLPASGQGDDLDAACASAAAETECRVAVAAVRTIHPRVGLALWGGSPVPGTASTLGMRIGSFPRFSGSSRIVVLPMELPPLPDRTSNRGTRALATGLSTQLTVGILQGHAPLPTVGGVLSLDAILRGSLLLLPDGQGFEDGSVLGWSAGLRLGALRESFTLPAVSLTGSYGRSGGLAFGDPEGSGDGHIDGAISNLSLTAAVTKRLGPVGGTAGATLDRYMGEVDFSYRGGPAGGLRADAVTDRWSLFGNVSWTFLIAHASLEAGWQESSTPEGLPAAVSLDPTGWWVGAALRLSI